MRPPVFPVRFLLVAALFASGLSCRDAATAPEPPGTIAATPRRVSLLPLDTARLEAVVTRADGARPANPPLGWASLDTTIARVSSVGVVTATSFTGPQVRTTRVIVTSPNAQADTVLVEVRPWPVQRVRAGRDSLTLLPRDSALVPVSLETDRGVALSGRDVLWLVSDTTALEARADGRLRARPYVGPQTRTVFAAAWSEGRADTVVVVIPPLPVASVQAQPDSVTLTPGMLDTLFAVARSGAGDVLVAPPLRWRSTDTTVVRTNGDGILTASFYAGAATRTARIVVEAGAVADTVLVRVTPLVVARVTIRPDTTRLLVGDETPLDVQLQDAAGTVLDPRPVTWRTGDTTIARISATGRVTASPFAGPERRRTPVLAIHESVTDSATIEVLPLTVARVTASADSVILAPRDTAVLTAVPASATGVALTGRPIAWIDGDTAVAAVTTAGVVRARPYTGPLERRTRVQVFSDGQSDTALVIVRPQVPATLVAAPDSVSLRPGLSAAPLTVLRAASGDTLTDFPRTWRSSDTTIARVSAAGLITAAAYAGGATRVARVSVSVGAVTDTIVVVVTPQPVATVEATPAAVSLFPLDTITVQATLRDLDLVTLTGRAVAFTSLAPSIATVDSAGRVTAAAYAGPLSRTAPIVVSSGAAADTVPVEVRPLPVARVIATPPSLTLRPGDTTTIALELQAADGRILSGRPTAWLSSDTAALRVSATGFAEARPFNGTASRAVSIIVFSEGLADTVVVTLAPLVPASITSVPVSVALLPGQQVSLGSVVRSASGVTLVGHPVQWISLDTTVARVNGDGIVSASFYAGPLERTASVVTSTGSVADTARVVVRPLPVAQVTVFPDTQTLTPNRTAQLAAVLRDSAGTFLVDRPVTWTSLDTALATISATGVVQTERAGVARFVAASGAGRDTVSVTIVRPVVTATLAPSLATVWIGRTQALTTVLRDSAGAVLTDRLVRWSSSNPAVATVSSSGVVSGLATGTATITARVEGLERTMTVDVFPEPSAAITITFDDAWRGVLQFAAPVLDSLRLRANVGWITSVDWSGVMTPPELRQLQDRGWSILSHSMTHPRLSDLSLDSATFELTRSRARVDSLGFDPRVFIVPFLAYNTAVLQASAAAGYAYTRCCAQDVWSPDTLVSWPIPPAARHRLAGVDVTDYTGQVTTYNFKTADGRARLRTLLQDVVARGKFIDVFFHDIVAGDQADLRATLEILAEFRPYLITYGMLPP